MTRDAASLLVGAGAGSTIQLCSTRPYHGNMNDRLEHARKSYNNQADSPERLNPDRADFTEQQPC